MQIMQNAEHFVISTRVSLAETNLTENKRFSSAKLFQLTSPQGDEPSGMFSFSQLRYFNSRLRKETNDPLTVLAPPFYLFQLTSQRGDEHKSWYTWIRGIYISTYVSLTETNVLVTRPNVSPTYFNSHPHKETNSIP